MSGGAGAPPPAASAEAGRRAPAPPPPHGLSPACRPRLLRGVRVKQDAVRGVPVDPAVPCRTAGVSAGVGWGSRVDERRGCPVSTASCTVSPESQSRNRFRQSPWLNTCVTPMSVRRVVVAAAHWRSSAPRTGPGRMATERPASHAP